MYEYFDCLKYFYFSQHGFRKCHSTEYAALEFIDKIITDMDKGNIPINIYLDMSKAFDILDHKKYADDTSLSSTLIAFDTDTENINRELKKIFG